MRIDYGVVKSKIEEAENMEKTKAEAAKVLLEAGWSWDEVKGVLDGADPVWFLPAPYPVYPVYPNPYPLNPLYTSVDSDTNKYYLDTLSTTTEG